MRIRKHSLAVHLAVLWGTWVSLFSFSPGQVPVLELDFKQRSELPKNCTPVGQPAVQTFAKDSRALFLDGASYLRFPGSATDLQFRNGTTITIAAWVAPHSIVNGQQVYVLGKGRTNRKGFSAENQNYALRLRGINGQAKTSFLFRSTDPQTKQQQFHRWNSKLGFVADGSWHHIAIQYQFGKPAAIKAWVDGKLSTGEWDMGGPTTSPPVVDNDELWVGSSLGGSTNSSFVGWIQDIQLFSSTVDTKTIQSLAARVPSAFPIPELDHAELANGKVLVEVFEQIPERQPPFLMTPSTPEKFHTDYFALDGLPHKYVRPGVIGDRSATFLVRCRIRKKLEAGDYELLLRAKSASALIVGNETIGKLSMMKRNASGHEPVPELKSYEDPALYPPPTGHQEKIISHKFDKGEYVFRWETLVGGRGLRNELGETVVAIRRKGKGNFQILSNEESVARLTYNDWDRISESYRSIIRKFEQQRRQELAALDQPYWSDRHRAGKAAAQRELPRLDELSIDSLVEQQVAARKYVSREVVDDETFLRRVYLDTIGIPPTSRQIESFLSDSSDSKRSDTIDKLLNSDGYADHWVSYWQDVLAENPGILKPKLNNTGPFRFYLYESLLDNKPLDRFAAELIAMQGSRTGGGPAGFGQATQNDVPTAAKANVLARAFLGIDLTCARCHDSPSSHFEQRDLFELAAMLNRKPIVLPKSSSVPNLGNFAAVKVTLKPGSKVAPNWPFEKDLNFSGDIPTDDTRRRLAELITAPENKRFSQVVANRIWTRIMGVGLVDSPDDFLIGRPNHPQLLDYLGNYLRSHKFDAKQLIRLILNSRTYQRASCEQRELIDCFAARPVKSLTAEQMVDSLYSIAGKSLALGTISFDPEGRRPADTFLNLGKPRRAWELTSLANERDRPALALPRAQSIVDMLNAFGWRESRPNPVTERDTSRTLIQPLVLANGTAAHRITQLSDDSSFTRLAMEAPNVETLVGQTYLQILGRRPSPEELQLCQSMLSQGFADRKIPGATPTPVYAHQFRSAVSWSNHLHPDATQIKLRIEEAVRRGDFATQQLQPDWRERMEDLVWALINSPEFILVK